MGYVFHDNQSFFHQVYVDDLHGTFLGQRKFLNLWIWLLAFELVGTPFGYHKFSGGCAASFVGYHIRYDLQQVGITTREVNGCVLGFVAQLLVWLKPHLAPLYAWGAEAAVAPGTVGRLPETAVLTLKYILVQLKGRSFPIECQETDLFRGRGFQDRRKM